MKFNGPPPQPIELKVLRGNPGKRKLPDQAVKPAPGARCPEWLSPAAKREWKRVAPELERLGVLAKVDTAALACYCEAVSQFEKTVRILRREGLTATAGNGTAIPHPATQINRQAMQKIREFSAEFALTPAARARFTFPAPPNKDNDDERFFGPRPIAAPPKARR